jgi:hypothetical protein
VKIIATFTLSIALAGLAVCCGPSSEEIQAEIDAANHCEVARDCVNAGGKCPFGCYALVNRAEVDRISSLIDDYPDGECEYDCMMLGPVVCVEGRCRNTCELGPCTP